MTQSRLPKIDVLVVTYNHEKYITRALDSVFRQLYDPGFRVVLTDDGSVDGTVEVAKMVSGRFPGIEMVVLKDINMGITKNYQRGFSACRAEYVAVLEGDDFWCSPHKLRKQVQFLEENWECAMCACNYYVWEEATSAYTPRVETNVGISRYQAKELIHDNIPGNFSCCIYRSEIIRKVPDRLFDMPSYDWIVNICVCCHGLLGFLNEPLSVYRVHEKGAWNRLSRKQKLMEQLALIPGYNDLTEGRFGTEFHKLAEQLKQSMETAAS